jgi:hypothetical protein
MVSTYVVAFFPFNPTNRDRQGVGFTGAAALFGSGYAGLGEECIMSRISQHVEPENFRIETARQEH